MEAGIWRCEQDGCHGKRGGCEPSGKPYIYDEWRENFGPRIDVDAESNEKGCKDHIKMKTGFAAQNGNKFPESLSSTSPYPLLLRVQTSVRRQHESLFGHLT